jgi:hypothetical protein
VAWLPLLPLILRDIVTVSLAVPSISTPSDSLLLVDPNLSLHRSRRGDYVDTATELVKSVVKGATFRVVGDHYVGSNGIAHVNFKQTANGLDIDNADFNINVSVSLSLLLPMLTVTRSLKMDPSFLMETPFSPALSPRTRLQSAISRIPSMH